MPLRNLAQSIVNVKNRCLKRSSEPRYNSLQDEEESESEAGKVGKVQEKDEKKKKRPPKSGFCGEHQNTNHTGEINGK